MNKTRARFNGTQGPWSPGQGEQKSENAWTGSKPGSFSGLSLAGLKAEALGMEFERSGEMRRKVLPVVPACVEMEFVRNPA